MNRKRNKFSTLKSPNFNEGSVPARQAADLGNRLLLKVEHLTMRFGGLVAVDDLSFDARQGNITALIGPNGAGKTTVFNCITGFYKPSEGRLGLRHGVRGLLFLEAQRRFVLLHLRADAGGERRRHDPQGGRAGCHDRRSHGSRRIG